MGIGLLKIRLSGGGGNSDPALSTGGAISSTNVLSQTAVLSAAIPGVTVVDAAGNLEGSGTLSYSHVTKTLTWKPPVDTIPGAVVSINANGIYLIRGSGAYNGYIMVSVVSASLSSVTSFAQATAVTTNAGLMLPFVDKDTAYAGATQYYLYYLKNESAGTIKTAKVQLQADTPGLDTLSVAIISAKNTSELQAAAAGHTYSAVGVDISMGDLLTTDYWGFWIKRVIPVATVDGVTSNTFKLLFKTLT